jgi:hypothetical protein
VRGCETVRADLEAMLWYKGVHVCVGRYRLPCWSITVHSCLLACIVGYKL